MWSICTKELRQFFGSLTGYITIIIFLLINGIFLFLLRDNNLFDKGYASLDTFFELAPWVLLFLAPALTMRTIADEFRAGTFETLQTRPLTRWQIVWGKYIAVLLVMAFAILPTLIYVLTLKLLATQGSIDSGGITGSYIGLFLLMAVFAAVGVCCSSLTSNAIVAFLLSAFTCLLLYFGFGQLARLPFLQGGSAYYVEMLGIDFHYRSISRGVLDSRDLVYFGSVIFFVLLLTTKNLRRK
jgi:ABC-2 type transport system permease protein